MSSELKVIKKSGHCYDGSGWFVCSFWMECGPVGKSSPLLRAAGTRSVPVEGGEEIEHVCTLFGGQDGVKKFKSESLVACDKIYGRNYYGRP